jgi:hypothetical protein
MTIYNFTMLNVPFANGAISTEIAPFPDWNRGLGIAFDQTDGKPEMKGLNGLFQVLTTSMLYLKQRGIAEWDSAIEYPVNAFVTEGAKLYKAKRTNTNKQPSLSQLDWDVWASISDISVSTNGNLKKTVAADGSVTLEVPTASDSQRGAVRQATSAEVANRSNVNAYVTPANTSSIAQSTDLGVGQSWQNVTSSRSLGVTYVNNTGRPILVVVSMSDARGNNYVLINGVNIGDIDTKATTGDRMTFIVPISNSYRIEVGLGGTISTWAELR